MQSNVDDNSKAMLNYNIFKSTLYSLIKNEKLLDKKAHKTNIYDDLFGINKKEIKKSDFISPPKPPINFKEDRINVKIRHKFFI